jgi:hypothetical protein
MNRTYICDLCSGVAVVLDEKETLLCSECFLRRTVKKVRSVHPERSEGSGDSGLYSSSRQTLRYRSA